MGRGGESKEDALKKLFVGGLSRDTSDDQFYEYFSQFGTVTDHIVIKDQTGVSKGFGFCTFETDEGAENAIRNKTDGHVIDGKIVEVKRAIPRDADPDQREKNTKMFLGGLLRTTTDVTIRDYFEEKFNCKVDSVDLIYERRDQCRPGCDPQPRGFAFVTINDYDVVDQLCVMRRHEIDGKDVEVKKAAPKGGPGGGGGGGGRGGRGGGMGRQGAYGGGGGGYGGGGGGGGGYGGGGGGGYQGGGYQSGGYQGGGGGYQGGYQSQGGYGGGGYQGGYTQGGYNQSGGYDQSGYQGQGQGGYQSGAGGYGGAGGYNQAGAEGGFSQAAGGYGGGYQNNKFSGPDKSGGRGGAGAGNGGTRQTNRGTYNKPY